MKKETKEFLARARWLSQQVTYKLNYSQSQETISQWLACELKEIYDNGYDDSIIDNNK